MGNRCLKSFNIVKNQRNTNQNNNEMSPHPNKFSYYKKEMTASTGQVLGKQCGCSSNYLKINYLP
jgi:hypothetical protein